MKSARGHSRLPFATFYCKNRYAVTPTFKTPGKVQMLMQLSRTTLVFTMKYCSFMVFLLLATPGSQVSPNVSQMSPRCLRDVSQMSPRCLPDISQMSPRCLPDVSRMSPRYLEDVSQVSLRCLSDVSRFLDVSQMPPRYLPYVPQRYVSCICLKLLFGVSRWSHFQAKGPKLKFLS